MATAKVTVTPTGREAPFRDGELIVSKTDLKGRITYCNDVFLRVAGFAERDLIGAPHSIIRHPDMPRSVFKLLWDTIGSGGEIFAYVINMAKNGDHYWVFAHVTPSYDASGKIVSFHSNRRKPRAEAVAAVSALYKQLKAIEDAPSNRKDGMQAAYEELTSILAKKEIGYDRFVLSL
jgi:PAS domain S-box-containing protein